ncbi:gamma-glutamyl-gamma-aminobutyrate hydrolase PuuD [Paraburkholderia sp. CI2]|uniref:gamma-glutamyl-gamma-aminobutyrate hydrolase family protein n=1 Tax=Paraburkholderia sp. CI2 TaxID=2723093 RepID=UPI0017C158F5|nr:gamma-glutamyl-gamma-aminobutyrate hydrolase PuuD [Paraburkholderia sp. CI2]
MLRAHPSHVVGGLNHHRGNKDDSLDAQYTASHSIVMTRGGMLERLAGCAHEARVNSLHGQGIARLGVGLEVQALAADGLIEAISVSNASA